ncbi:MAG TPA: penicillin acylase family protein [Candidatus Limnocylindrales bacterium]
MRIVRRLLAILVALVLVVAVGAVALLAALTGRGFPQTSGTLHVAGLGASVTVVRDEAGIAQIYATDSHDLFLAQGYVHAQERLWQMEVWRHIGAGRLAELFGPSEVHTDRFIRTLGLRQAAERDLAALPAELRAALAAYADGVNAYIADHRGSLGVPFVVTALLGGGGDGGLGGYTPEPWTPLDSVTWQKVEAFQLGANFDVELFRIAVDARLGDPARTDQLLPPYRDDAPVIVPSAAGAAANGRSTAAADGRTGVVARGAARPTAAELAAWADVAAAGDHLLALTGLDRAGGLGGDHSVGSNNWVVGPSHSASGRALLANDPHLGISMPSVWYMNGLHCRQVTDACPWDVVGVTFPGFPFVVLGHNERIAWGATNLGPDVQDLVEERLDPGDPGRYVFGGDTRPFETRGETIRVAGGADVPLTVRSTTHGPILNDVDDRLKDSRTLYALRWTATSVVDTTLESFYEINRASDWPAFRAALSHYVAPSQNFVYADVDGHIGYQAPGWIPVRQDPNDRGDRPVPGWDGRHEWTGPIPYDELPRLYDPASGLIVTANNAVVDAGYPHFIAAVWDPGFRARRILDVLGEAVAAGGVTIDDMSRLQVDTLVGRAPPIVDGLGRATATTADGREALGRIRSWDGHCDVDSIGCSAFMVFEYRVERGLVDDELGDLARNWVGSPASWVALAALLARPTDRWWDVVSTRGRTETASDIVTAALDATGRDLRAALGSPARWTWGRLHTAVFREATYGVSEVGPLEWYFDVGPRAVPGAAGAVNSTSWRLSRAYANPYDASFVPSSSLREIFEVTTLPNYRFDVDMGDLDGARIVQTTGQSGNPFDRHYGDLVDDWLSGRHVPLPFSSAAVDRAAAERLELRP